jgi:Domain of unknown function (DUF4258)
VVAIDPEMEIGGPALRALVRECLEGGRIVIPKSHAKQRMDERHVTAVEVEGCLRSGSLRTESSHVTGWRYRAEGRGVCVIFTIDLDGDGNLIVVVTTWRLS